MEREQESRDRGNVSMKFNLLNVQIDILPLFESVLFNYRNYLVHFVFLYNFISCRFADVSL